MKKYICIISTIVCFVITSPATWAGDFDGSKSLLVSVIRVSECTPDGACRQVSPASIGLPQFLKIDFVNKTIIAAASDVDIPPSIIERQEVVDGKLILQGAEDGYEEVHDGLGWTIAISDDNGQVVLTASGEQVAFVAFGACLPL